MTAPGYDPVKAHEYYMRTRKLKGRRSASINTTLQRVGNTRVRPTTKPVKKALTPEQRKSSSRERAVRLTEKLHKLQAALQEATKEIRIKRQAEQRSRETQKKNEKKNSDGKTTAKERATAKKYRDTHKAEIKAREKKASSSSGGSKSSSSSTKKSVSDMSISELTDRISSIKSAISSAKKQLKEANSLSHSQFVDNANQLIHDGIERPLTLN